MDQHRSLNNMFRPLDINVNHEREGEMTKYLVVALVCLWASAGAAQTQPAEPVSAPDPATSGGISWWQATAIGAGSVGGLVLMDVLTGGALTGPLITRATTGAAATVTGSRTFSPAALEARRAGAVLGEMIQPATSIRDNAARKDVFWVLALAAGALGGGTIVNWALSDR